MVETLKALTDKELRENHSLVRIEFPEHCERIGYPAYTFKIAAAEGVKRVSLCIDGGDWLPCRESGGRWWFDWAGFQNGEHEAVARLELADGRLAHSEPRWFMVNLA